MDMVARYMHGSHNKTAHPKPRAQSAIEYLTTYGWAILLIVIALGALFQLGVFDINTLTPRSTPGSCRVYRPNGPYTTQFIKLEGACNNAPPQYVINFYGISNAASSIYAYVNVTGIALNNVPFSLSAWIYGINLTASSNVRDNIIISQSPYGSSCTTDNCLNISVRNSLLHFGFYGDDCDGTTTLNNNVWYFVTFVYNASQKEKYVYINGKLDNSCGSNNYQGTSENTLIGMMRVWDCHCAQNFNYFNGELSNLQLYSTAFTAPQVKALYLNGVGGTPTDMQHLTGWWPLNSNTNDYSGNDNNGQMWNVSFRQPYLEGYTTP